MAEVDDFLAEVLPKVRHAETALHDGDPGPRARMWSREDPVTLFGAVMTRTGWGEVGAAFSALGERFGGCESFDYEVVAADARGDLAYIVGVERTTAVVGGVRKTYVLRSTTIYRREGGQWKAVHRHGDAMPDREAEDAFLRPG